MDISSTSNSSYSRAVTPSKNSSDRQSNDDVQMSEIKSNEKAQQQQVVQDKLQQSNDENERRLDGRLVTFGYQQSDEGSQKNDVSFNRSRVKEAYNNPPKNEVSVAEKEHTQHSKEQDAIDIVV